MPTKKDITVASVSNRNLLHSLLIDRFNRVDTDFSKSFACTGDIWFADSAISASGIGTSWATAKKTIAEAAALAAAGDTIFIKGSFSEAVILSTAGVSIIGAGTTPNRTIWTGATDTYCLTLGAGSCVVQNIRFRPPTYTSGTPAAICLGDADYAVIRNCRFQGQAGSRYAIYSPSCLADNVVIEDCEFIYMNNITTVNGSAIVGVEAGGATYAGWQIRNCRFNSCVVDIDVGMRNGILADNVHHITGLAADGTEGSAVTGLAIDLSGTGTGSNVMTRCTLGGTYNLATYKPAATGDVWMGNYASIVVTVAPNGLTVAVPAA